MRRAEFAIYRPGTDAFGQPCRFPSTEFAVADDAELLTVMERRPPRRDESLVARNGVAVGMLLRLSLKGGI